MTRPSRALSRYCWIATGYTVLVVLWGAYVRATGSGAGCGSHWPLCNGEVVPRLGSAKTIIEFAHRATSGLAWISALVVCVWAFRSLEKRHPARLASAAVLFFMTTEALVGAGLVLFEMVAGNQSIARAVWMACHLVNTFLLLLSWALTSWFASEGPSLRLRDRGFSTVLLLASLGGVLVLATSGAVAALGDTLFPAQSLAQGLRDDLRSTAHFLVRLRILHPLIGLAVAALTLGTLGWIAGSVKRARGAALGVCGLIVLQVVAGFVSVALLAPVWIQLVHLLFADAIWIGLVLVSAVVWSEPVRSTDEVFILQPRGHNRSPTS